MTAWRCLVCGYVHNGEQPPECCPVCGAGSAEFEAFQEEAIAPKTVNASQWRCSTCGYIHDGDSSPDICPVCAAAADLFEPVETVASAAKSETNTRIVIVGAGIAGVAAAEAARESAPDVSITILSQEHVPPYYRLNLTRYLADDIDKGSLPIHPPEWYSENNIALDIEHSVTAVLRDEKNVKLSDETLVPYDALILTPGSHAFIPPIPGAALDGVCTLRTVADADDLLRRLSDKSSCVVIGGGILGIETAGALGQQGINVSLLESHEWLMPRQLNRRAAERLEKHIADMGVSIFKNARTHSILGDEKAEGIRLDSDERVEAAVVVLATGVRPNSHLARKAGLEVDKGIVVNNHLLTSDPSIYAAGDAAEHNGMLYGAWAPSQYQGKIAGLNSVGGSAEFGGLPRANTLKVLGVDLLSIGQFSPEDGSYIVLDHEDDEGLAHFVFRDARMVGCILMDHPSLAATVKQAMETGRNFSRHLSDGASGLDVLNLLKEKLG